MIKTTCLENGTEYVQQLRIRRHVVDDTKAESNLTRQDRGIPMVYRRKYLLDFFSTITWLRTPRVKHSGCFPVRFTL